MRILFQMLAVASLLALIAFGVQREFFFFENDDRGVMRKIAGVGMNVLAGLFFFGLFIHLADKCKVKHTASKMIFKMIGGILGFLAGALLTYLITLDSIREAPNDPSAGSVAIVFIFFGPLSIVIGMYLGGVIHVMKFGTNADSNDKSEN